MAKHSARDIRFTLQMDEQTYLALCRLSQHQERTMAGTIRFMIREAATRSGHWPATKPALSAVEKPAK